MSYKDYNNFVGEYIKEYPDRLIGFAAVDPRRGANPALYGMAAGASISVLRPSPGFR